MISLIRLRAAVNAFVIHLGLSVLVAVAAGAVVLRLWYPHPYWELMGGQHLFWILVGVDTVCGPLLTAILFNPKKSQHALRLDLTLVAAIQLAALLYGMYSISKARPVVLAFEVDRFVAVAARQVVPPIQPTVPYRLSWNGPELMGTREPKDGAETLASINLSLQGLEPSARPGWWQPYEASMSDVKLRMRPLSILRDRQPLKERTLIDAAVKKNKLQLAQTYYLPLVSHKSLDQWIALLDGEAHIIGYAPVGGF